MSHHHHPLPGPGGDAERYRATRRITLVGAVVNILLAVLKMVVGWIGHSQALIADGVHSLSDLATDAMVLVESKHASREADETHPYGHARIETAFTVGLGVVLILVALGILADAVDHLFHPTELSAPGVIALGAAAVSVLAKEVLYRYTLAIAQRLRSALLKANAWHHRSDAISSLVVIVGIAGTMAGLPYLDAIAAVVVAVMIIKIGWDLSWHSLRELVDTALDEDRVQVIRDTIEAIEEVQALHSLRTRRMGQDALVDVHILVDPEISVSEGHHISETVRLRVVESVEEVQDVLVHIDPEDDENSLPSINLPSRAELSRRLWPAWEGIAAARDIDKMLLHYLDGEVVVELFLPLAVIAGPEQAQAIAASLARPAEQLEEVREVRVCFH